MVDMVNNPPHYTSCSLESIQMMRAIFGDGAVVHFCVLNAFKYLWRYKLKNNPMEDLEKAEWYILQSKVYNRGANSAFVDFSIIENLHIMIRERKYALECENDPLPEGVKIPDDLAAKAKEMSCLDNLLEELANDYDKSEEEQKGEFGDKIFKVAEEMRIHDTGDLLANGFIRDKAGELREIAEELSGKNYSEDMPR